MLKQVVICSKEFCYQFVQILGGKGSECRSKFLKCIANVVNISNVFNFANVVNVATETISAAKTPSYLFR